MTGTVIVTMIPYNDIGDTDFVSPTSHSDSAWGVRVHPARDPFAQKIDSPLRRRGQAVFPAVHRAATEGSVYFAFLHSAEAQDAYGSTSSITSSWADEGWASKILY
jgi:hypothetical protein